MSSVNENPILNEPKITQIKELAQQLGQSGYQFKLILEPRGEYQRFKLCEVYHQGPFSVYPMDPLLSPMKDQVYQDIEEIKKHLESLKKSLNPHDYEYEYFFRVKVDSDLLQLISSAGGSVAMITTHANIIPITKQKLKF